MRVLCIDIEGGHGGSSKSLFSALASMNRSDCEVEVICQRHSQIVEEYYSLGIRCEVWPKMPKLTALNNWFVNLFCFPIFYFYTFPKTKKSRLELLKKSQSFDLLHANHISLTPLLVWLKKNNPKLKIITHIRTNPKKSVFSRFQASSCLKASDDLIFITENELATFRNLSDRKVTGHVIYNSVRGFDIKSSAHPFIAADGRLKIVSLSNFSQARGVDRLLDVAKTLPSDMRSRVLFVVVGDMSEGGLQSHLPWRRPFQDRVRSSEFSDMFVFTGHLSDPTTVLHNSDLLFKLTRENNPWGRDILEALSCGLPVVSIGSFDKFVKTGETGLLQNEYSPEAIAKWLKDLASDQSKLVQMSKNAKRTAEKVCSAELSSNKVKAVWQDLVASSK